jgi:hypothetical protein
MPLGIEKFTTLIGYVIVYCVLSFGADFGLGGG